MFAGSSSSRFNVGLLILYSPVGGAGIRGGLTETLTKNHLSYCGPYGHFGTQFILELSGLRQKHGFGSLGSHACS
jgi:hypothetical protein